MHIVHFLFSKGVSENGHPTASPVVAIDRGHCSRTGAWRAGVGGSPRPTPEASEAVAKGTVQRGS